MKVAGGHSVSLPSATKIKMDDRKRSLAADPEDAYPSKRHATSNGANKMSEMDMEADLEEYRKDAILRQMLEFKRERDVYRTQLSDLTKQSHHHDDHLRIIDAWFAQLLDEIRLLAGNMAPTASSDHEMFRSALQFQTNEAFQEHLKDRSTKIRSAITDIFGRIPTATPEIKDLQERMAALLANEKAHIVECQRIIGERDQLTQRLEQASYRYLLAEKKVDRAKSGPVHKMESRAIMGGYSESGPTKQKNSSKTSDSVDTNGNLDPSARAANEAALKEATALADTRKLQTDQLESENKRLTEDLTAAQTRLTSFTDDDYAKTDLFKLLKSQHEDVIKRVNDLEATNVQLREEAQKLQGERTAYRTQLEEETRAAQSDLESQLARTETDLARIRNIRDELQGDVNVRAAQQEQQTLSTEQAKELAGASQNRIVALESELERLRLQLGQSLAASTTSLDDMDTDALKLKVRTLESQYALLEKELPSMEAAWRKTQALATKKVAEIAAWEEQKSRLLGEKAKADQKYFSAMKAKESRDGELRMLKAQNARSSEMVSQLKENEGSSRTLVANLEKQLSESKESLTSLSHQNRSLQQRISDITTKLESSKTEVAGLKKLMVEKDSVASAAASSKRDAEVELKKMEANLSKMKKELQSAKENNAGVSSNDDPDHWRRLSVCPVCNVQIRNHVLKTCGHVFCQDCIETLVRNRNRKCPICYRAFGNGDHLSIIMN